jgi:hypothetical protein
MIKMQNIEKLKSDFEDDNAKNIKLIFALLRKKENKDVTPITFKQIIHQKTEYDPFLNCEEQYKDDFEILKTRIKNIPGIWRIYESVNRRDTEKAQKELIIRLINDNKKYINKIDSLWKTCLMQPKNKSEHYLLIDIDTKEPETLNQIVDVLKKQVKKFLIRETINGYHIKTEKFDTRLISTIPLIEIKHDALLFITTITIPEHN